MGTKEFKLWTVYQNPSDYPGQFVAREFVGDKPTDKHFADTKQEPVHNWIIEQASKEGLGAPVRLERDPSDDPCIVCTFI